MGPYVADRVARLMMARGFPVVGSRILVLGVTFKENCPDLRNSKVLDVIAALKELNAEIEIWDPQVSPNEAKREIGLPIHETTPPSAAYDAVILAVAHRDFAELGADRIRAFGRPSAVFFDVKGLFGKHESDGRL
jgi:UDP-N-acetyl-D-galactosamine dehydrogenase